MHSPQSRQWVTLVNKSGEQDRDRGELEINISWIHDDGTGTSAKGKIKRRSTLASVGGVELANMTSAEEMAEVEAERKKAAEAEAKRKEELDNIVMKHGDYQVQVHIIELRNLKPEDPNGSADPVVYAKARGGHHAALGACADLC